MPTLDWIGKQAVLNHHQEVPTRLLHCDGELSAGDSEAGNLLVQGDNLDALKALLPYYAGQVKCIYIDPPYNTGNEGWVYNDNVNSPEIRSWLLQVVGKEGEDLSRHDKWLCMMYPRLRLLRDFLTDDGAVFISCDGNELHNLIEVGRQALGISDSVTIPVVNNMKGRNDKAHVAQTHEYVVLFAKRAFVAAGLPLSEQQRKRFKFTDERGERYELRDLRKRGGPDTRTERPNLFFEIYRTADGRLHLDRPAEKHVTITPIKADGEDGRWRWDDRRVRLYLPWLEASYVRKSDKWNVSYRVYLNPEADPVLGIDQSEIEESEDEDYDEDSGDAVERSTKPKSFWWGPEFSTDRAGKHLKAVLGKKAFDYPKPVDLIWRVISMAGGENCLVLDSFGGSGTTGEAALKANSEDGQKRRFILVEMDSQIAQTVTAQRLTNVIEGYRTKRGGANVTIEGYGGGFRYCTLGKPLFDEWGGITEGVTFADLAAFVFFSDTGSPIPAKAQADNPLIGTFKGRAIYLLWSGDSAGVASEAVGNVLTPERLASLPMPSSDIDHALVVYGEGCTVAPERLALLGITFKQIPYQVIGA